MVSVSFSVASVRRDTFNRILLTAAKSAVSVVDAPFPFMLFCCLSPSSLQFFPLCLPEFDFLDFLSVSVSVYWVIPGRDCREIIATT